eukprot:759274-Hanusia_phi.AAC.4
MPFAAIERATEISRKFTNIIVLLVIGKEHNLFQCSPSDHSASAIPSSGTCWRLTAHLPGSRQQDERSSRSCRVSQVLGDLPEKSPRGGGGGGNAGGGAEYTSRKLTMASWGDRTEEEEAAEEMLKGEESSAWSSICPIASGGQTSRRAGSLPGGPRELLGGQAEGGDVEKARDALVQHVEVLVPPADLPGHLIMAALEQVDGVAVMRAVVSAEDEEGEVFEVDNPAVAVRRGCSSPRRGAERRGEKWQTGGSRERRKLVAEQGG